MMRAANLATRPASVLYGGAESGDISIGSFHRIRLILGQHKESNKPITPCIWKRAMVANNMCIIRGLSQKFVDTT